MQTNLRDLCLTGPLIFIRCQAYIGHLFKSFLKSWVRLVDLDRKERKMEKNRKGCETARRREKLGGRTGEKKMRMKSSSKSYISCGVKVIHDTEKMLEQIFYKDNNGIDYFWDKNKFPLERGFQPGLPLTLKGSLYVCCGESMNP